MSEGNKSQPQIIHKIGTLKYNYDSTSHFGELSDLEKMPIYVDVGKSEKDKEVQTRKQALSIVHNNFLPHMGIYIHETVYHTVYHKYEHDLISHLGTQKLLKHYTIPSECNDKNKIRHVCMHKTYRVFFRSIVNFINFLHRKEFSISTLSLEKNFIIHNKELKLCNLTFISSSSDKEKQKDFTKLANVLEELFVHSGERIPLEVEYLCKCMRAYNYSRKDHILLENHLALLPTSEKLDLIKCFYERSPLVDEATYQSVFAKMINDDWTSSILKMYKSLGPVKKVYDRKYLDKDDGEWKYTYKVDDVTDLIELNSTAIRFCRNMASHLHATMKQCKLKFSSEDIELTIMALFAKQLLSFEEKAHHSGILENLLK